MSVMEVDLHKLKINDPFLGQYQQLVRDVVIPYQWDALNDRIEEADPSHAIENFRIAAGRQEGEFYGMVFQDSDVAKWLEAVAWSLCQKPDPGLEKTADEVIELVAAAQCEDGYLNTYFTVKAPEERWTNLAECHELYCAGHMIEAGVAFFQATGKRRLLEVVCRLADHIDRGQDSLALRRVQEPRHLGAVLVVRLVQRVQQQDIADVQQVGIEIVPVDVRFAEPRVCAAIMVKCALLADRVRHDCGKRRQSLALHAGGVGVRVLSEFFQHIVSFSISAHTSQCS